MSLRKILAVLLPLAVLALTVEILWRRHVVGQIPTQFPAFFVYALIGVNVVYLCAESSKLFKKNRVILPVVSKYSNGQAVINN